MATTTTTTTDMASLFAQALKADPSLAQAFAQAAAETPKPKAAVKPAAPKFPELSAVELAKLPADKQLAYYKAFNEYLVSKRFNGSLTCKVSEKGALSVYGLSAKFPVTLYIGQWERLIAAIPTIQKFAAENKSKLAVKSAE